MGIIQKIKEKIVGDTALKPTPFLSRFKNLQEIGSSAMSTIYKSKMSGSNEVYAIKRVKVKSKEREEKLKRELEISFRLSHEGLIKYHAYEIRDDSYYILMEFFPGDSLREFLRTQIIKNEEKPPFLEVEKYLNFFQKLIKILIYIHSEGVLHLDIKPGNILFDREGRVKLIDFGISVFGSAKVVSRAGSSFYVAPEVLTRGEMKRTPVSEASDIYSLGATMYELACGSPPFLPPFFDNKRKNWIHYYMEYSNLNKTIKDGQEEEVLKRKISENINFDVIPYHDDVKKILARCLERAMSKRYSHSYMVERDIRAVVEDRFTII